MTSLSQMIMDKVLVWNIRGNDPNKQRDLKLFCHENKIGLCGLVETKIKVNKVNSVLLKLFSG